MLRFKLTFGVVVALIVGVTTAQYTRSAWDPQPKPLALVDSAYHPTNVTPHVSYTGSGRRPNVMRAIMGMGAVSLQGPGSTSGNPIFSTVRVPQSSGIMCFRSDIACAITNGEVALYYDSGNTWNVYAGGANRISISNSNGTITMGVSTVANNINGNTAFNTDLLAVNATQVLARSNALVQFSVGTAGTAWLDIQSTGAAFAIPLSTSGANDITAGHSFITSSTTGGVAVTGVGGVYQMTNMFTKNTAPTISSGFGSSPSIVASNGSLAFQINVGTGGVATSGVIGLPTAATGWICKCDDITTENTTVTYTKQTASTTTTCTVGNFTDIAGSGAWVASDKLNCTAVAY